MDDVETTMVMCLCGYTHILFLFLCGGLSFLNAVLQNVARLSALRSYFLSQSMPTGEQGLTLSLRVFFHTMWLLQDSNNNSTIRPNKLLDLLGTHSSRFRGFEQQDAHEALRALLESLMEEASTMNNTEDTTNSRSWVDDIFLGKLQSCVECEQCHSVSKVEEPFLDISLSLESQDTEETCCSVAGGCHDVTKSPNYPMNTARDENTFPTFPVVLYDNNNNNNNSDPPMVSLFDEEDIHQATLGLDSLFVESNIVTSNHCFSQKNTTQGMYLQIYFHGCVYLFVSNRHTLSKYSRQFTSLSFSRDITRRECILL